VRVGWRAHFGSDEYSDAIYALAKREGIDLSLVRRAETPYRRVTAALPLHGERAFVTHADPDPDDQLKFWADALDSADYRHVHIGGALPPNQLTPLAREIHARGATLSMDCADVPLLRERHLWGKLLPQLDIFMPNAREARMITGEDAIEDALQALLKHCHLVVIKDGAAGALIGQGDEKPLRSPGIRMGACVDTTGAGDCFNAGFLYGWGVERAELARCALYGNICGGLSVTGEGGATTAPTREDLMRWAQEFL
jgi:sugar/nucleoside kinase (ribokinase family)